MPGKSSNAIIPSDNLDVVDGEDEDVKAERERVREMSRRSTEVKHLFV